MNGGVHKMCVIIYVTHGGTCGVYVHVYCIWCDGVWCVRIYDDVGGVVCRVCSARSDIFDVCILVMCVMWCMWCVCGRYGVWQMIYMV